MYLKTKENKKYEYKRSEGKMLFRFFFIFAIIFNPKNKLLKMLEGFVEYGYIGLFLAAFLAATILPLGSEFVFVTLIAMGLDPWICTIVATIGNWLGGMTNYYLGKIGKIEWIEKYLKVKKEKIDKIKNWLDGKGASMAFLSFLPIVGDIIAIALGYMRANVYIVNITMFSGKFLRYVLLMYGVNWVLW